VLRLDELKVTTPERAEVSMVSFVLEAPSDFTHRTVQAALNKPVGGDAEPGPSDLDLAMEPLAVGTPAPDWTLPTPDGTKVSLSGYAGKVVVLDFWGTWCPFCLKAMPQIQKLHEGVQGQGGVVVVGLNTENDPSADPAGFMRQKKYTYGLVLNAEKVTRAVPGVRVPHAVRHRAGWEHRAGGAGGQTGLVRVGVAGDRRGAWVVAGSGAQ
jgi:peroxiredoxin